MISRLFAAPTLAAARALLPDAADDAEQAWARAMWSMLVEPGDGVAGALVAAVGPVTAFGVVAGKAPLPPDEQGGAVAEGLRRWRPRLVEEAMHAMARDAARAGLRLVTPESRLWPRRIDDLGAHAPLCLWVRGDPTSLAGTPALAVVGARASTSYGEHVASEFAGEVSARGITVVSGAAYGIDGAAHRAALSVGGRTVAVLAGGADRCYPAGHAQLIDRIAGQGAVVSEVPPGFAPTKWRFLQRNRVIAALADATLVVEAGWRSGSLNTAGHAAALGRPLGAVPGAITSAGSAGCHRLLREYDARCVTSVDDALELLGAAPSAHAGPAARPPDQVRVLDALSARSPRTVDDLARRTGLSPADTEGVLGLLTLEGLAVGNERGWRRASGPPRLL